MPTNASYFLTEYLNIVRLQFDFIKNWIERAFTGQVFMEYDMMNSNDSQTL